MSFINNAHPGSQINLLCLIYRLLLQNPNKFTREELQNYCAPDTMFNSEDHKKRFRDTLAFWSTSPHQLWFTDVNERLALCKPNPVDVFRPNNVSHELRHVLMQIEFSDLLGEEDEFGASKAIRSFAYILTQDRFTLFRDSITKENLDKCFASNFVAYALNDSEKSYFIEFCNFLGITERVDDKEYLDPTRLLRSFLDRIFDGKTELKAHNFIKKMSEEVPILANGKYAQIVRELIGAEVDTPNRLSIGLSHAINRLVEAQILNYSKTSDDIDAITLVLPDGNVEQFSSVTYLGGA